MSLLWCRTFSYPSHHQTAEKPHGTFYCFENESCQILLFRKKEKKQQLSEYPKKAQLYISFLSSSSLSGQKTLPEIKKTI